MYILDSNVFIQAKNLYYGFDIFPIFWSWLDEQFENGNIVSVKPVYDELMKGNDELSEWIKDRKDYFIEVDDFKTQEQFALIVEWTANSDFKGPAKKEFLDVADPLIIAKAITLNAVVVTHESLYDKKIKKKIKIPNVCEEFSVKYISTFELLRELNAKF